MRCMSAACISLRQTLGFSRSRLLYGNRLSDDGCYHFLPPCEYLGTRFLWTRMDHASIHHGVTAIALISITPDEQLSPERYFSSFGFVRENSLVDYLRTVRGSLRRAWYIERSVPRGSRTYVAHLCERHVTQNHVERAGLDQRLLETPSNFRSANDINLANDGGVFENSKARPWLKHDGVNTECARMDIHIYTYIYFRPQRVEFSHTRGGVNRSLVVQVHVYVWARHNAWFIVIRDPTSSRAPLSHRFPPIVRPLQRSPCLSSPLYLLPSFRWNIVADSSSSRLI